jgi:hypothetical protein
MIHALEGKQRRRRYISEAEGIFSSKKLKKHKKLSTKLQYNNKINSYNALTI